MGNFTPTPFSGYCQEKSQTPSASKVPEGHHPRGTTLSEEICLSEGSAGVSERALRGLSEGSAVSLCEGSAGGPRDLPRPSGTFGLAFYPVFANTSLINSK